MLGVSWAVVPEWRPAPCSFMAWLAEAEVLVGMVALLS